MSAMGQTRKWAPSATKSALPLLADMPGADLRARGTIHQGGIRAWWSVPEAVGSSRRMSGAAVPQQTAGAPAGPAHSSESTSPFILYLGVARPP